MVYRTALFIASLFVGGLQGLACMSVPAGCVQNAAGLFVDRKWCRWHANKHDGCLAAGLSVAAHTCWDMPASLLPCLVTLLQREPCLHRCGCLFIQGLLSGNDQDPQHNIAFFMQGRLRPLCSWTCAL